MSASQAAEHVPRRRGIAASRTFLADCHWSRDWNECLWMATLLLEQNVNVTGRWVLILDQTFCSQQGDQTENTYSTGNRHRRPRKGVRYNKYKHTRKRCHCFVMGLLLTPSGMRIPVPPLLLHQGVLRAEGHGLPQADGTRGGNDPGIAAAGRGRCGRLGRHGVRCRSDPRSVRRTEVFVDRPDESGTGVGGPRNRGRRCVG